MTNLALKLKMKQFERKDFENIFVVEKDPKSPISEAFRTLRTNIKFSNLDKPIKTLLITSPIPEAGKSSVSINLALTMAQDKYKVVLVDTDLRKPTIHKIFQQDNKTGLTNILVEDKKLKEVMRRVTDVDPNLYFIPSGPIPPNPSELLGSNRMKELIIEIRDFLKADFNIYAYLYTFLFLGIAIYFNYEHNLERVYINKYYGKPISYLIYTLYYIAPYYLIIIPVLFIKKQQHKLLQER